MIVHLALASKFSKWQELLGQFYPVVGWIWPDYARMRRIFEGFVLANEICVYVTCRVTGRCGRCLPQWRCHRHLPRGVPPCHLKVGFFCHGDRSIIQHISLIIVFMVHMIVIIIMLCSMHTSVFICRVIHALKVEIHPRMHHRLCSDSMNKSSFFEHDGYEY